MSILVCLACTYVLVLVLLSTLFDEYFLLVRKYFLEYLRHRCAISKLLNLFWYVLVAEVESEIVLYASKRFPVCINPWTLCHFV